MSTSVNGHINITFLREGTIRVSWRFDLGTARQRDFTDPAKALMFADRLYHTERKRVEAEAVAESETKTEAIELLKGLGL